MIQCKVLKQLENLDQQKYDDEDITDDIKFLLESLGESVQDLRYQLFILIVKQINSCGSSERDKKNTHSARLLHFLY